MANVSAVKLPDGTTYNIVDKTSGYLKSHQDISGKADKSSTVSNVAYDTTNKKLTKTINGTTSDIVTVAKLKTDLGSMPASDVYSWAKASSKPSYSYSEITGTVPTSALPSYVDDVLEYSSKSNFPSTGETGKIYVDTSTNLTWRWGGSSYAEISPSLALGETSATAYRGDRGKTAYDHSQSTHARTDATAVAASSTNGNIKINGTETTVYTHPGSGTNPHGTTKSDVGLGNVGNFKAVSTVASQGLTDTEKSNARANIGAGTSSLTLGTSSSTAYRGDYGNTAYSHATDSNRLTTAQDSGLYKIATTAHGHIKSVTAVAKSDITGLGIPAQDTTYSSKSAASGGTAVSLVTTGEKYNWDSKAAGNHTHTTSIATSTGTNQLTLAYGGKYAITAGGTSYIFTMPSSDNTNTHRPIQMNGTEILGNNTTALNLKAGTNVTLSNDGGTVTITSTDTNTWRSISDSVSSTSSDVSASSKAVKTAYDLAASKTANTGTVTSVAASGSGGISISGSPITTSGTITIGVDGSTVINNLSEGSSNATRDDYIVAQYAGGGTSTTSYHRRKLSNIFAALNKSDITTALGYTPPTSDTNTWRGIQDNLTSATNTTESLSAKQGYLLANGSARDSTKLPLTGGKMSGNIELNSASGNSPAILFTRDGGNTDWKVFVTSGKLSFLSGTDASTFTERAYFKDNSGDFVATSFTGNGSALTSLNASNISSGTIAAARLPSSGATAGSYGDSSAQNPSYGATFKVPYITVDTYGRVTAISEHTVKIPSSDNTWRGIQDNLTSSSNTTESLSAKQGYLLANGSARDSTKLPLSGGTVTGSLTVENGITSDVGNFGDVIVTGVGRFTNGLYGDLIGNASTATKFSSARSVTLTGDTTGTASADGSSGWSIATLTKKVSQTSTSSLSSFTDSSAFIYTAAGGSNSVSDKPTGVDAFGCMSFKTADGWYGQLLISSNTSTGLYWRTATSLSSGWKKLLDSNNYNDYTPTKTGTGASGIWSISISGTASKATADADGNTISSTYLKLSGGTMTGQLKWNGNNALPQFSGSPTYLLGIEGFANGGTTKWQNASDVTVGSATKAAQDGSGNVITSTYVKKAGDSMSGTLIIETGNSYASYNEGIRINKGTKNYSTLLLGGTAGSTSGTNAGAWWIGTNNNEYPRRLMIAHNGSGATGTYFYTSADSTITPNLRLGSSGTITSGNMDAVNGGTVYTALGSYLPLSGGTMTGTINLAENNVGWNFRAANGGYYTTASYQTAGNEALVFATKQSVTSFMFVNGEDSVTNHSSNRWYSLTPGLQIKNNKVSIGKLIGQDVTPTYPLDVNGSVNATDFIVNTKVTLQYNTTDDCLKFVFI